MEYKKVTNLEDIEYIVRTNDDGSKSWIPLDPANSDYQAYLAEQSTPEVPLA